MIDPDLQEEEETLVPITRLRGEQAAAAEDKEFSEDETRKKLILNFPAISLTFLEAEEDVAAEARQFYCDILLPMYNEWCKAPSDYVRQFAAHINH